MEKKPQAQLKKRHKSGENIARNMPDIGLISLIYKDIF